MTRCGARIATVVALASLVAVAGCTGDDDTAPTSTVRSIVTTTTAPASAATLQAPDLTAAYFDAIAQGRPAPETVAVPGSDADVYARFRSSAGAVLTDLSVGTVPTPSSTPSSTPGVIDVCDPDCTSFTSVEVEPSTGRLTTFSVDGAPLAGRIVGDGLRADDDGVIGRITSAYRNQAGDVLVVVEVRNTTGVAVELFGFGAVYQPVTASTSREATGWWGPESFDAGIGGDLLLSFAAPSTATAVTTGTAVTTATLPLGSGRVSVSGLRSDGVPVTLDLTLPRAGG